MMIVLIVIGIIFLKLTWRITKFALKLIIIVIIIGSLFYIQKNYAQNLLPDFAQIQSDSSRVNETPNLDPQIPTFQEQMEYYSRDNQKRLQQQYASEQQAQALAPTAENYKKLLEDGPRQLRSLGPDDSEIYHDLPPVQAPQQPIMTPLIPIN